jgi:hypothetical protein
LNAFSWPLSLPVCLFLLICRPFLLFLSLSSWIVLRS